MTFNTFSLDHRINEGIKRAGFTTPTPIQESAIPTVLEGSDILGIAQTGTGKTAAFILPILHKLMQKRSRRVRALVLAPTRELAEQIHQDCRKLGETTGIKSVTIYGGVSKNPQKTALRRGAEIIIACPGRLLDHLSDKSINLSSVEVLVLDEADRMCDMGFLPDIKRILKYLPSQRQTLFFSATMPKEIRDLADTMLKDPKTLQIGATAPVDTVSHSLFPVPQELKKSLLFAILEQTATGRVLIFTRTKHKARTLASQLMKKKFRVSELQGNMSQKKRQDSIDGFRRGKFDILVATDIASRGIDVSEISHVINFDMPDTVDAYTRRIGRTGRALNSGDAFTLSVTEDEPMLRSIEKLLGSNIERKRLSDFDYGDFDPEKQVERKTSRLSSGNGRKSRSQRKGYPGKTRRRR